MSWLGRKRLALIPVFRPDTGDVIPADWSDQIVTRMLYDPQQFDLLGGKRDQSLRTYIHTVSSGLADLDFTVMPMQTIEEEDVPPDALEAQFGAQLRAEGFDAAAIVMLGGVGSGTTIGYWSRFAMADKVGEWAMEFMHHLTGFGDLYPFGGNMGAFDEMACSCGTHPSAYTKAAIGWLDPSTIAQYPGGGVVNVNLHSVGLIQPPPTGRVAAVQIGSQVPYLMVEARQYVDQFDSGILSEGVIVYRVQTPNPLGWEQDGTAPVMLLTTTALTAGQSFTSDAGIIVTVTASLPGGFSVTIGNPSTVVVPDMFEMNQVSATKLLNSVGLKHAFTGSSKQGAVVFSQNPQAGTVVNKNSIVSMFMRVGEVR
jgi:PASTA domain